MTPAPGRLPESPAARLEYHKDGRILRVWQNGSRADVGTLTAYTAEQVGPELERRWNAFPDLVAALEKVGRFGCHCNPTDGICESCVARAALAALPAARSKP